MALDESKLEKVKKRGNKIIARCPACAEGEADRAGDHLSIDQSGAYACVKFPGDEGVEHRKRIFELVGIRQERSAPLPPIQTKAARKWDSLLDAGAYLSNTLGEHTRTDYYHDLAGAPKMAVLRFDLTEDQKKFRPFHRNGSGWLMGDPQGPLLLFNLPELAARREERVFVTEGEKAATELLRLGVLVTTSSHGSSSAGKTDWSPLAGRDVVIFPDNDDSGEAYAEEVAKILSALEPPAIVRVVSLPDLPTKGDIVEWMQQRQGRTTEELRTELEQLAQSVEPIGIKPLVPLMDIAAGDPDPRKTLLGNRYLCMGGGMLFVGPSGIGKSSGSVQQDLLWGLGREAFGIRPARPLHILTIQAENDAEDLAEMREGVCAGLNFSEADREQLRGRVFYETESGKTGREFLAFVESKLRMRQFDLLRIDPFQAYLGADVCSAADTAAFLRNGLNPLLIKYGVGCILNHHTPKVTNRDTSGWRGSDWMYAGAGSADVTNWARAALVIDPTHASHVFKFIAAKRGNRIGWADEFGERETVRHFAHSNQGLFWREATIEDLAQVEEAAAQKKGGKPNKTPAELKALVPNTGAIPKRELIRTAQTQGFGVNKAKSLLNELVGAEELFEHPRRRPGTNAEVWVSRHELSPWEEMR